MSQHIEWQGVAYPVPPSAPAQDRRIETLSPIFWAKLAEWIRAAQPHTPLLIRISETRRTLERQVYLYAQGRLNDKPKKSWTLDSRHRYGLAADIFLQDRSTHAAEWDPELYKALYAAVPPHLYNLKTISKEYVHLELANADEVITSASQLGLWQA